MMSQKREEFTKYTTKLKDKIENASINIKRKIDKHQQKLLQYKNLLANKMEKSQKRLREGFFTTCKKPSLDFSRHECLQIFGYCKGKGKGIDVTQILECMKAENPKLGISITPAAIQQSMYKNANTFTMRLRFLKQRRHLREIKRLKKSEQILKTEKLAEERLKKNKDFIDSNFTADKMIKRFDNRSEKTLDKTQQTISALKRGDITKEQVLSSDSSRLAFNEVRQFPNKPLGTSITQGGNELKSAFSLQDATKFSMKDVDPVSFSGPANRRAAKLQQIMDDEVDKRLASSVFSGTGNQKDLKARVYAEVYDDISLNPEIHRAIISNLKKPKI
jgi:hypothetical protein